MNYQMMEDLQKMNSIFDLFIVLIALGIVI